MSLHDPLAYLPVLLLVILIWTPESIVVSRYVGILRASVEVGLFYLIAGQVGLLRKVGRARPLSHPLLRPKPDSTRPQPRVSISTQDDVRPAADLPQRSGAQFVTCILTAHQHFALFAVVRGRSWKGSASRAMREALESLQAAAVSEIDAGHYFPSYRSVVMRGANRLLRPLQRKELEHRIAQLLRTLSPDVFLAYKGYGISRRLVRRMKAGGYSPSTSSRITRLKLMGVP